MTYSPWSAIGELEDVIVGFVPLPDGMGWWEPDERVMLIDSRLDRVCRRCTAAHELEHILAGDEACVGTSDDHYYTLRTERRASIRAARKLIPLEELAEAILLYDDDDFLVAEHLDVDLETLDVRRDSLHPQERHYLRQRMAEREETI